jgi:hypothetical protein
MAMAVMYPEAYSAKNGKGTLPFSKMRLAQERSVLHHSRSLAETLAIGFLPACVRAIVAVAAGGLEHGETSPAGDRTPILALTAATPALLTAITARYNLCPI